MASKSTCVEQQMIRNMGYRLISGGHNFLVYINKTAQEKLHILSVPVPISTYFVKSKAALEPQVLPAFAITYFYNHCNISPTPMVKQWLFFKLNQKVNDP